METKAGYELHREAGDSVLVFNLILKLNKLR